MNPYTRFLLIEVVLAAAIALAMGRQRQIGLFFSFWLSVVLTPVGGAVVTWLSELRSQPAPTPNKTVQTVGWVLIAGAIPFGLVQLAVMRIFMNLLGSVLVQDLVYMQPALALASLGVYLVRLGMGYVSGAARLARKQASQG